MLNTFLTIKYKNVYIHMHMESHKQVIKFSINGKFYKCGSLDYAKKLIRREVK